MRRTSIAFLALLLPVVALALDYSDRSVRYSDAPFSVKETAGISVLTNLGVVGGNPDGSFAPSRTLNRAEFTKIVMRLKSLHPTSSSVPSATYGCFPDVRKGAWYEEIVCGAKAVGIVSGNAKAGVPPSQWLFEPGRSVLYAEALKMLVSSYGLPLTVVPTFKAEEWYEPYIRAAGDAGIGLDGIAAGTPLTRGQMARLAAMFEAQSQGELALYFQAEQGNLPVSSSSISSSSSSVSSAQSSSSSVVRSSSSVASLPDLPARSHLLLLGTRTPPIASAMFGASLEAAIIRGAEVKLKTRNDSIDKMYLVDRDGVAIGTLTAEAGNLRWKGTFSGSGVYKIPKDAERVIAVEVKLRSPSDGGVPEQLLQVESLILSAEGEWSGNTYASAPQDFSFPQHQTVQAKITSVKNNTYSEGLVPRGANQLLAEFAFSGVVQTGAVLQIENLEFTVNKASSVAVQNWKLKVSGAGDSIPCSVNDTTVSCSSLSADFGTISPSSARVLQLYGDTLIDQGAMHPYMEVDLGQPGSIGVNGAVRWTDGAGHYTWTEFTAPVVRGTRWTE